MTIFVSSLPLARRSRYNRVSLHGFVASKPTEESALARLDRARRLPPFLVLALILLVVGPASAQQGRGLGDVTEIVEVNLVNIDVRAIDRSGLPITDLEPERFRLYDDDRRVKITNFRYVEGAGDALAERLSLVIFVDDLHLTAASRDALIPELKELFLRHLDDESSGVSGMVVSHADRLRVLQDLTPTPSEVVQALNQIELLDDVSSPSRELETLAQSTVRETLDLLAGEGELVSLGRASLTAAFGQLRIYADAVHRDTVSSLESLASIVGSLGLVPGRKVVLYIGEGLATSPLDRLVERLQDKLLGSPGRGSEDLMRGPDYESSLLDQSQRSTGFRGLDARPGQPADARVDDSGLGRLVRGLTAYETAAELEQLAARANANRINFFTLRPPPVVAAEAVSGERAADVSSFDSFSDLQGSLLQLAALTGGEGMVAGRDVAAFLDRLSADLGGYYSLGFSPPAWEEGAIHRLRLKVKGSGVELRYPQSYIAKSLRTRVTESTTGALLLGWTENPHQLTLERETGADGETRLTLMVPLGNLSLLPGEETYSGQIRVAVVVLTEDRERLPPRELALPLRIPAADWEQAREQFFAVNVTFDLPRGDYWVAAGLWDETSGTGSFIRQSLIVRAEE